MICSVLIPSRGRPERLRKTIQSISDTSSKANVEVLVRFDDDDAPSIAIVDQLLRDGIGVVVGPRRSGYPSIGEFYAELAAASRGAWIWIMNDDAYVTGPSPKFDLSWDKQLGRLPSTGVIVQPECYQLGHSKYWSSEGGAFPAVPNGCWTDFGEEFSGGAAVDTWLDQLLRVRNGWQTSFLDGVAVVHERDADDVLAKHRELKPESTP